MHICLAIVEIRVAKSEAIVFCGGYAPAFMQSAPSYDPSSCINAHAAKKPSDDQCSGHNRACDL